MKLPFDEIWLINLVSRPDRYKKMKMQFKYFGWDVKEHRTVIHTWCEGITKSFKNTPDGPNAFSCAREHYTLIKSAYLRGLESICIIEDDVSFYTNKTIWEYYLNNLPNDWDVLRICSLRGKTEQSIIESDYPDSIWSPVEVGMWGTGCYALSRKGMEYMLKTLDRHPQSIDKPLHDFKNDRNIKHYLPKIPLGLCLEDSLKGDISQINSACKFYFKDITNVSLNDYQLKFKRK
jgi:GR25 family glycosyltransferase involved in LPS biosynthesis